MICCSEQCDKKEQCGRFYRNPQPECRKYDNVESLATHGWGSISPQGCEDHYDCGPLGDYKMFEPISGIVGEFKGTPIEILSPSPDEIIVFKFKTEALDLDQMRKVFDDIKNAFQNNTVVAIPDNSCFEVFTKDTLISSLQDVIKQLEES